MCAILKDAKLRLKLMRQELQFPVRKIITVKAGIQTENNKKLSDSTVSFSLTHLDTEQREYLSGESQSYYLYAFCLYLPDIFRVFIHYPGIANMMQDGQSVSDFLLARLVNPRL